MDMDKLAVEVRCGNGVYYKAFVVDVLDDCLVVKFESCDNVVYKGPFENMRFPPETGERDNFSVREQVELYMRSDPNQCYGWWQAVIIQNNGFFHVVQVWISGVIWTVTAPREFIRQVNNRPSLNKYDFRKVEIEVPRDLSENCDMSEACAQFALNTGVDGCFFDPVKRVVMCISRCELASKRASFLRFMFIDNLRNEMKVRQMKESASRLLDARKMIVQKRGQEYFMRKFGVKDRFVRFAKVSMQDNIDRAYAIDGIAHIDVNRSRVTFNIYGKTRESTLKARSFLDYTMDTVEVPRKLFEKGRGRILKEIQRQCRFLHVNPWKPETQCARHMTQLVLVGPKDNVETAKVMLKYHSEHLYKTQELMHEKSRLERELRKLDNEASGNGRKDEENGLEDGKGATLNMKRQKKHHDKKKKQKTMDECERAMCNLSICEERGDGMQNRQECAPQEGLNSFARVLHARFSSATRKW